MQWKTRLAAHKRKRSARRTSQKKGGKSEGKYCLKQDGRLEFAFEEYYEEEDQDQNDNDGGEDQNAKKKTSWELCVDDVQC